MARTITTFKKGEGGKKKGSLNRTTRETKEILVNALGGHIDNINEALNELKEKDIKAYLDIITKLLVYILPKQSETDLKGNLPFKVVFDGDSRKDNTETASREAI